MSEFYKNPSSESGLSSLRRQVSVESGNVLSQLSQSLIEEKVFLALQSIKLAASTGRITVDDATILKRQMVQRVPFETSILKKLRRGERFCLLDYDQRDDDLDSSEEETSEQIQREIQSDTEEVDNLKKKLPEVCTPLCFVCNESSVDKPGIFCENKSGPDVGQPDAAHFQCSDCLTTWVEVLNGHRVNNADLLRERHGLVRCCVLGKISLLDAHQGSSYFSQIFTL